MKKIKSLVMILPLVLVMFVTTNQAEAATSSWQSVSGVSGCQVRVWTDATTYYKSASTVDWYAQTNGSCGTLNYAASLKHPSQNITQILDGSFSNQTPTKSFTLTYDYWPSSRSGNVEVNLYKGSTYVGKVKSANLYIYGQ